MTNKHSYGPCFPRTFQLPSSNQTWRAEKSTPIDDFPIETSPFIAGFPACHVWVPEGHLVRIPSTARVTSSWSEASSKAWLGTAGGVLATGDEMKPPQNCDNLYD